MKVYFLRHGPAVETGDWSGDDASRPLTAEGRAQMEREAAAIAALDLGIGLLLASPLVRAQETALMVALRLDLQDRLLCEPLLGLDFNEAALGAILTHNPGVEALMLVGHEPGFSRVIAAVTGGLRVDVKKGSLACVRLRDASSLSGELSWLLPPKFLSR